MKDKHNKNHISGFWVQQSDDDPNINESIFGVSHSVRDFNNKCRRDKLENLVALYFTSFHLNGYETRWNQDFDRNLFVTVLSSLFPRSLCATPLIYSFYWTCRRFKTIEMVFMFSRNCWIFRKYLKSHKKKRCGGSINEKHTTVIEECDMAGNSWRCSTLNIWSLYRMLVFIKTDKILVCVSLSLSLPVSLSLCMCVITINMTADVRLRKMKRKIMTNGNDRRNNYRFQI